MFERFTGPARSTIVRAQDESRALNHDHIGTSHLLLALLREGDAALTRVLAGHGVTHEAALARVERAAGRGVRPPTGHIPFSANAKSALEQAAYAAEELGQDHVDAAHVLLGLLRVRDAHARALLADLTTAGGGGPGAGAIDALTVDAVRIARQSRPDAPAEAGDSFAELLAEYRGLAAALGRFGRHAVDCPGGDECRCGLTAALGRAVGVLGDETPVT